MAVEMDRMGDGSRGLDYEIHPFVGGRDGDDVLRGGEVGDVVVDLEDCGGGPVGGEGRAAHVPFEEAVVVGDGDSEVIFEGVGAGVEGEVRDKVCSRFVVAGVGVGVGAGGGVGGAA